MAKEYETRSGKSFNANKGASLQGWFGLVDPTNYKSYGAHKQQDIDGKTYNIPYEDMNTLTIKEIKKLITETNKKGRMLNDTEIKSITGSVNGDNKIAYYHFLIDENEGTFGFDSTGKEVVGYNTDGTPKYGSDTNMSTDYYNMINGYKSDIRNGLMLNSSDAQAQQYLQDQYSALERYSGELEASLAASEMSAYRQIGQQQLQLENQIADQRMRALKSGVTSAQLASQEIANLFAAQSGAAQVANNAFSSRLQNYNNIAQQRFGITQNMYNQIAQNQSTYASALAQLGATEGNYYATMNQPYAQYDAYAALSQRNKDSMNTTIQKPYN